MRLFLVFLFLYLIPIMTIFYNHKNIKRKFIYASTYTVLMTSIAISNVYISTIHQIEEVAYYKKSIYNVESNEVSNKGEIDEVVVIENIIEKEIEVIKEIEETSDIGNSISTNDDYTNYVDYNTENLFKETELEMINNFKKEIYETELIALKPMRDCIPYTKDILGSLKKLGTISENVQLTILKCDEVIKIYENMKIPELLNEVDTLSLEIAKEDVISCYEIRKKAMIEASNLIETKNIKYVNKITEYLDLSDEHILNYKERVNETYKKIEER
ncbi:MAG: hypothetical protein R3Y64_07490 [Peptostreptococcaceae bacterium]